MIIAIRCIYTIKKIAHMVTGKTPVLKAAKDIKVEDTLEK